MVEMFPPSAFSSSAGALMFRSWPTELLVGLEETTSLEEPNHFSQWVPADHISTDVLTAFLGLTLLGCTLLG